MPQFPQELSITTTLFFATRIWGKVEFISSKCYQVLCVFFLNLGFWLSDNRNCTVSTEHFLLLIISRCCIPPAVLLPHRFGTGEQKNNSPGKVTSFVLAKIKTKIGSRKMKINQERFSFFKNWNCSSLH